MAISLSPCPYDEASDDDTLSQFPCHPQAWLDPPHSRDCMQKAGALLHPSRCISAPRQQEDSPEGLGAFGPVQDQGPRDLFQQLDCPVERMTSRTPHQHELGHVGWWQGAPNLYEGSF